MSLEFRDPDLLHDLMMTISGSIGKEGNHIRCSPNSSFRKFLLGAQSAVCSHKYFKARGFGSGEKFAVFSPLQIAGKARVERSQQATK